MNIWIILTILSFLLIVLLCFYIKIILKKLFVVADSLNDLFLVLKNYSNHLSSLYEMETFYGDQTLEALLKHSREVVKYINSYESIYSISSEYGKEEYDVGEGMIIDEEKE